MPRDRKTRRRWRRGRLGIGRGGERPISYCWSWRALPGVPGLVATVASRVVSQDLIQHRQTTCLRRCCRRRAQHPHVHRILFPTSVTIASRPS